MRSDRFISRPAAPRSRRHAAVGLAVLIGAGATASPPAFAVDPVVTVVMDKAKLVKFPANTETIVVGNPIIADVTMLKSSGLVVLTGRGFGETNLVFLDRTGAILSESNLRVQPSNAVVTVQRGLDRESYACHPRCEPTVSLGDASGYMKDVIGNTQARNAMASPSAPR